MNFVKKNILKTAFLILILTLSACNMNPSDSGGDSGGGKILLNLSAKIDNSSRVISPITNPDITGYELYGALTGGNQTLLNSYNTLTGATASLDSGTWDFTLKAFNSSGEVFLSGSKTGVVLGSAPVGIEFVLKPLVTGNGTIAITVSWPDTISVASVVTTFNGVLVSPALIIDGNSMTFSKEDVATGSYMLSFNLNDTENNTLQVYSDIVTIYPGMVSSDNIILTDESFKSVPNAPSGLSVSNQAAIGINGVVNLTWTDNSTNESGFEIYLDNGTTLIGTVNAGETSYLDTTAIRGLTKTYKIRGINVRGNSSWAISGSITIPWLISFNSHGGSSVTGIESHTDSIVTSPTEPTHTEYTFGSWFKEAEYTNNWDFSTDTVSINTTLHAKWVSTVIYDSNGAISGTVPVDSTKYETGGSGTVLGNTGSLVKSTLVFKEWNTKADGTGDDYAIGAGITITSGNITLYAKFRDTTVGDIGPSGGYIFYDKGPEADGWRYLEDSSVDLSAFRWGTGSHKVSGADALAIGTGKQNTMDIINGDPATDNAAHVCVNYSIENNGIIYDDWFLPSKEELYSIKDSLSYSYNYWTSSQFDSNKAYLYETYDGTLLWRNKTLTNVVRPVRTFNWTSTITYSSNGGTSGVVPEDTTIYDSGTNAVVLDNTGSLAKTSSIFKGWNTRANGTGTDYSADEQITLISDITLYAKWGIINGIQTVLSIPEGDSISFSDTLIVVKGASLSVTVQETFSTYKWYLDGVEQSGETFQSITIPTDTLVSGIHELMVMVTSSTGNISSGRCQFSVTN